MRPARTAGFTLVEVLVALVVMATMAAMAWRGIDALVKSREIAQARLAQTARLQTVLAQWDADLRALQDSKSSVPPLSFDGGSLTLTRQQPEGLQVVVWSLRESSIYRWASPSVLTTAAVEEQFQRSQQALAQRDQALRAFEGVSGWQFYCYWGNAWSNCLSSGAAQAANAAPPPASAASGGVGIGIGGPSGPINPNPAPTQQTPEGVRMLVQFAPGSGLSGSLTRETVVSVQ